MFIYRVSASRTESVTINFSSIWSNESTDYEEFPTAMWIEFFTFIFNTCPNLKKLNIRLALNDSYDGCVDLLLIRLHVAVKAAKDAILTKFIKPSCEVHMNFFSFLSPFAFEVLLNKKT